MLITATAPKPSSLTRLESPSLPCTNFQAGQDREQTHNFPVSPFSVPARHVQAAEQALAVVLAFQPELLLVSAGFDAFMDDPLTQMTLRREDFARFGEWLGQIDAPTAAILEGGYSEELPELIDAFLSAWQSSDTKTAA